jgi:hypothetical protein
MSGPGECRVDCTEGITRVEDLPKVLRLRHFRWIGKTLQKPHKYPVMVLQSLFWDIFRCADNFRKAETCAGPLAAKVTLPSTQYARIDYNGYYTLTCLPLLPKGAIP